MQEEVEKNSYQDLKGVAAGFPDSPGVYLFKDGYKNVLYVGKANSLKKRIGSYFNQRGGESPKVRSLVGQAKELEFILTEDENQALLLESNLIKKYRPRYNVVLRDDKSYPYLKLTIKEDFPRIQISRRPLDDGSRYYGPFPNLKLREILKMIYRYFNIRDCDLEIDGKAERACLSYQIKQCPAPCIGVVSKHDYSLLVKKVQWFLEGKLDDLAGFVKEEMLKASDGLEFEEAIRYRDLLESIQQIQSHYTVITNEKRDVDVMALIGGLGKILVSVVQVRQGKVIDHVKLILENELDQSITDALGLLLRQYYGPGVFIPDEVLVSPEINVNLLSEKLLAEQKGTPVAIRKAVDGWRTSLMSIAEKNVMEALKDDIQQADLLKVLKTLLRLSEIPRTIACFDISTLQGSFTVGSAILFKDGVPDKSRYRKFKIKEVVGIDDYRSHQEMMRRYLKLLEKEGNPVPDLFLIDGGKGQLAVVDEVLSKEVVGTYGLASLAKREEEIFVPWQKEPVDFGGNLKARHLLQRIRDESHRFAVGYHRTIRDRQAVTSMLQNVRGVGPSRLRALLNRFDSMAEIAKAPLEEIEMVPGFSKDLASRLFKNFHP